MTSVSYNLDAIHNFLILFLAISFLFYGYTCLYSNQMKSEFKRLQLNNTQQNLTGILQLLGGIFLLVSLAIPITGLVATAGLSLQMLLGFIIRLKIKDSFILLFPSFIYMILSGYLFLNFLKIYI